MNWIKTSERLPPSQNDIARYLVWNQSETKGGKFYINRPLIAYWSDGCFWMSAKNKLPLVTHWMPIKPLDK